MKGLLKKTSLTLLAVSASPLLLAKAQESSQVLETINVIGDAGQIKAPGLSGSVDILSREELEYEHVNDTLELFSKIPGVYFSRYNQGLINADIAIRGFAGDGSSPHAALLIDGMPANLHNGYNELDQLFPIAIDNVTVVKGNSDASLGLNNVAGNYRVNTRKDKGTEVELTAGSFDTQELQAYTGFSAMGVSQHYSLGVRSSEGYRDHTDLEKMAASANWHWHATEKTVVDLNVRLSSYDGDAPGYLDEESAQEDQTQSASYAGQEGGDKQTEHLSVSIAHKINDALKTNLKVYNQNFERERWVRFSDAGDLTNRFDDQTQKGFIANVNWDMNSDWSLEVGANYQNQDNLEQRFGTINNERVRDYSSVSRNYDYDVSNVGIFTKLNHKVNDRLEWNVAVRIDQLDGDFVNLETGEAKEMYDFGTIVQPKLNVTAIATESLKVFANVGRSFQTPFGSAAYTADDTGDREVSLNDGWELGSQWFSSTALTARFSLWQQVASDEYITVDGTAQNIGETNRQGYDLTLQGDLFEKWSYWGSYTKIDSEIIKGSDDNASNEGNEIRSIPSYTASLGLNYQVMESLITRLHIRSQGDYYVNEANAGGKFGGYTTLGVSADYQLSWGVVKFQINNLTDEYTEYVYDFSSDGTSTIHSPGAGVNGSVSLAVAF
jgi:iron complex outermembrane receptor protein